MVRYKVRLEILSKEDMKDIENETMDIEKHAKRQSVAKNTIEKRKRDQQRKGGIYAGEMGDALPSSIIKKRTKTLASRVDDAKAANAMKAKDKTSAQAIKKTSWAKEKDKEIDGLKEALTKTNSKISEVSQAIDDPAQLITRGLMKSKGVGKVAIAMLIVTVAMTAIITKLKSYYGPGGPGDIRKLIKDEVATVFQLDHVIDINAGRTFFTADLRVRSGAVNNSVSGNLGDDSMLYRHINIGRDILNNG